MNIEEIYEACSLLSLVDKTSLRDDLNQLISTDIGKMKREMRLLENEFWSEIKKTKNLEDTLVDRLEEIKELKKNE